MLTHVSGRVRTAIWLAAVVAVAAVIVATARGGADAPATSDMAVIESYTLMASRAQLLVGAYSRFQWHHPGPLYFYLLAPFYVLAGGKSAGLSAGAAALSLASMAGIAAVLLRRAPRLAVIAAAGFAVYAWRAADAVASAWNPHVPVLPAAALIVAAADVLAGNPGMLPVTAFLASLAGQAHIALVPTALAVGAIAFVRGAVGATRGSERDRWRRSLIVTGLVLVASWALPLYEQITATPRGNLTELYHFFAHQAKTGQPLMVAVSAWSDMMVGIFRPDFYVAHGWPFVESPVRWAEWLTLIELGATAAYTTRAAMQRDRFGAALGGLLLMAAAIALWSATRISEHIFDHDVFWMTGIGVLVAAVTIDLIVSVRPLPWRIPATAVRAAAIVLLAGIAWSAVRDVAGAAHRSFEQPEDARIARALAADLEAYMGRSGVKRPLVKIDQDAWGEVAGALLDLQKRGRIVSVEEDWVVMFTPLFRPTGHEDAVITVATRPEHLRLVDRGVPVISSRDPVYAHAAPISAP